MTSIKTADDSFVITETADNSRLFLFEGLTITLTGGETETGSSFFELLAKRPSDDGEIDSLDPNRASGSTPRTTRIVLKPHLSGDPKVRGIVHLAAGTIPLAAVSLLDNASKEVEESAKTDAFTGSNAQQAIYGLLEAKSVMLQTELEKVVGALRPLYAQREAERQQAIDAETVRCVLGIFRGTDGFGPIGKEFFTPDLNTRIDHIYTHAMQQDVPRQPSRVVKRLARAILTYKTDWIEWDVVGVIVKEAFSQPGLVLIPDIRERMIVKAVYL